MTLNKAIFESEENYNRIADLAVKSFSGTVKLNGEGVRRKLLLFKFSVSNSAIDVTYSSSVDGSFSFSVVGNKNDMFTIMCIGKDETEQTTVYSSITGG